MPPVNKAKRGPRRRSPLINAIRRRLPRKLPRLVFDHLLAALDGSPHPMLVLRVNDVAASLDMVHILETKLEESIAAGLPAEGKNNALPVEIEALGKARERLRKSMSELEDLCARAGASIPESLGGIVQPLLEKAAGVLEEAMVSIPAEEKGAPPPPSLRGTPLPA